MSKDSTQAFIEAFKDTSNQCVQCGDDNDLLVKFTAHKVCGKCARANHRIMVILTDKNAEGAWRLSAFVGEGRGEYLVTRSYYFYTKAQAIKQFKQELKGVSA